MNAEETKVLKQIIGSIKDYNTGSISDLLLVSDMVEALPDSMELQNYIVALETDLDTAHMELDEAEHAYEELYHDYNWLDDEVEMMMEEYEEEDYDNATIRN